MLRGQLADLALKRPGKRKDALDDVSAVLGEHYQDYLVMVRDCGRVYWVSSDRTWGKGAAAEYATFAQEATRCDVRRRFEGGR